jgi:hypothetical protein
MESKFGKFAMPIAALGGGVAGAAAGAMLGPVGMAVGGLGGAFMGAVLFMSG